MLNSHLILFYNIDKFISIKVTLNNVRFWQNIKSAVVPHHKSYEVMSSKYYKKSLYMLLALNPPN